MKTLTKEERKEIYLRLSNETDKPIDGEYYTCWKLFNELGYDICNYADVQNHYNSKKVIEQFPEFLKACSEFEYWNEERILDGMGDRRTALLRAAELCD